jgi:hypothetical protein
LITSIGPEDPTLRPFFTLNFLLLVAKVHCPLGLCEIIIYLLVSVGDLI